jgi:hypothetical protein
MVIVLANSEGVIVGTIIGIIVGFLLALIVLGYLTKQPTYASVIFERDESGRIVAIRYVQGGSQNVINVQKSS